MNYLSKIKEEIVDQYLNDPNPRPWIVGFSGGKDSTMLLQLVWLSLAKLPKKKLKRHIYVICNNTLVENPRILRYSQVVLSHIEKSAKQLGLPISTHQTTPLLEETFWVNLIGKGYPAPNRVFRWCTERLKINPTTKFILERTGKYGEVIVLLGTRSDESSNRATSLKKHSINGQRLLKHSLPNTYVYAPIKNVTTDEVWQYLMQVESPWGVSNKKLLTLYKNANGGDCPLVIDTDTPSCGKSRFGCWVCTVVNVDKSMESLIDHGDEWMKPLLHLRNLLANSRFNQKFREKKRRNGTQSEKSLGPYKLSFRAIVLEKLLKAQKLIQVTKPDIDLINYQELVAIQVQWFRDNFFETKVANIYKKVYGENIEINLSEIINQEKKILEKVCAENPDDVKLIEELIQLQKTKTLLMNKRYLSRDIENRLSAYA